MTRAGANETVTLQLTVTIRADMAYPVAALTHDLATRMTRANRPSLTVTQVTLKEN